jgi:chromosomal replication initiator protein
MARTDDTKPTFSGNLEQLWQNMLAFLRLNHSDLVRSWFSQLRIVEFDRGHLALAVANPAQYAYLQNHCTEAFVQAAQSVTACLVAVTFNRPANASEDHYGYGADQLTLNDEYSFDNFVTGPCNKLAHAASVAVAREPGKRYNPLFVYGSVGLGKTHLAQAICQEIVNATPGVNICYISCETFINHFIEAVEMGLVHEFRHRYRNVDLLVIDDVQFLANKDSSQEEFFHTFNTLYQAQKQIVLTSDRPPNEIEALTERLISRFSWGLVAGIDRPCFETRMAILQKKARLKGVELPAEVTNFLARSIDSNTRQLEGAVTKLQGLAMLGDGSITMDMAQQVVPNRRNAAKELTIEEIVDAVTKHFNIKLTELQSKRRNKTVALPRQVCMFLSRQLTRRSLEEIGGYFGGRDHSTVLHAAKNVRRLMEDDPEIRAAVEELTRSLVGTSAALNPA